MKRSDEGKAVSATIGKAYRRLRGLVIALSIILVAGIVGYGWLIIAVVMAEDGRSSRAEPERVEVIAIGDSITQGREDDSYPRRLQRALGSGYRVRNFGVSGSTLQPTQEWDYRTTQAYRDSLTTRPDIVLIMLGTNDSKPQFWNAEEYRLHLIALVAEYRALPSGPSVFLLTPPVAADNDLEVRAEVIADEVVPIVGSVAALTASTLVDVHAATESQLGYLSDGVHPDGSGYRLIADTVASTLRREAVCTADC